MVPCELFVKKLFDLGVTQSLVLATIFFKARKKVRITFLDRFQSLVRLPSYASKATKYCLSGEHAKAKVRWLHSSDSYPA